MKPFRRTILCAALALPSLCLIAQRPSRPSEKSAREFVNLAYGHEVIDPAFDVTQVFTPSLKKLVDANRGHDRKIGKLDFDPLCDCQDTDGLEATTDTISVEDRRADVSVALTFHNRERRQVRLTLLWTPNIGWRIDNISTSEVADLRGLLSGKLD